VRVICSSPSDTDSFTALNTILSALEALSVASDDAFALLSLDPAPDAHDPPAAEPLAAAVPWELNVDAVLLPLLGLPLARRLSL
jgi:hypothetical protein